MTDDIDGVICLFEADTRASRMLDVDEGHRVARLGATSKDDTLYRAPVDGDHFLILGAGKCEALSYAMVEDEDGQYLDVESDCSWSENENLTLAAYRMLAEKHVTGRKVDRGLSLFLKQRWMFFSG